MAGALYYYADPRPFLSFQPLQPADSSLNYWFYPDRDYMNYSRIEAGKPADGKAKEGDKKGDKKDDKKDEKKDAKKDDNKPKHAKRPTGTPDFSPEIVIELKVPLCCESCARRVRKKLEKMEGVEKPVLCDMYEMKVTVSATAKPEAVLKMAQKVKKEAEMWPQKKK